MPRAEGPSGIPLKLTATLDGIPDALRAGDDEGRRPNGDDGELPHPFRLHRHLGV